MAVLAQGFIGGAEFDEKEIGYGYQKASTKKGEITFSVELAFDSSCVKRGQPAQPVLGILVTFPLSEVNTYRELIAIIQNFKKAPTFRRDVVVMAARSGDFCRLHLDIKRNSKEELIQQFQDLDIFSGMVPA